MGGLGAKISSIVVLVGLIAKFSPIQIRHAFDRVIHRFIRSHYRHACIIIEEIDSDGYYCEEFSLVQTYITSQLCKSVHVVKLIRGRNPQAFSLDVQTNQTIRDQYEKMWVQWKLCSSGPSRQEKRYFELMFHKDYHDLALEFYIPYVFEKGAEVQGAKRVLCTNRSMNGDGGLWSTVDFHLPSTFDTIAVNNEVKNSLKKDLVKFSEAKELYVEAGRAWKRSYLIHGPSGTGKTTLVAAIANELCFNLYDIDLGSVHNNFHLRKLLISTRERSVIVFEDIDKWVVKREGAENQRVEEGYIIQKIGGGEALITMTGLLNLIDGLWSSCFLCEKVMVFTATNIENLDPSLLRPGRMDMHMTLTYTRPLDFEALTNKYFDLENDEIEVSIRTNMQKIKDLLNNLNIIPAEIAEVFMRYSGDPAKAMEMLMWKLNGTIV